MIAARLDREAEAQIEPKVSIPGNLRPRRINRVIIELCCADDSRLGQLSRSSEGCLIVRVTESDDLTREDTVKKILWFVKNVQCHKIPVLIWVSIPCTGGTRLTDLNWVVGTDKTRELIENHRTLYLKLFHSLRRIGQQLASDDICYAIEWPEYCKYSVSYTHLTLPTKA